MHNDQEIVELAVALIRSDFSPIEYICGDDDGWLCGVCGAFLAAKYEYGKSKNSVRELKHRETCLWIRLREEIEKEFDDV